MSPYLAGTHDEKMFRVVKDRERWVGVVMVRHPTPANGPLNNRRPACHCPQLLPPR
jgi:hypothetical protein